MVFVVQLAIFLVCYVEISNNNISKSYYLLVIVIFASMIADRKIRKSDISA